MTEANVGGADTSGGAATEPSPNNDGSAGRQGGEAKPIDPQAYESLKSDLGKWKDQARSASAKIAELSSTIEQLKNQKLQEQEDYKSLYEQTAEKLAASEQKREQLFNGLIRNEKQRRVMPELAKAGLREDAVQLLELETFDDIDHELGNQGSVIVGSVDSFVERFKQKHPYAFQASRPPIVNNGGGSSQSVSGGPVTVEQVNRAYHEAKRDPSKADEYKRLAAKYQEQRRA